MPIFGVLTLHIIGDSSVPHRRHVTCMYALSRETALLLHFFAAVTAVAVTAAPARP